jgi:hypothetical protein
MNLDPVTTRVTVLDWGHFKDLRLSLQYIVFYSTPFQCNRLGLYQAQYVLMKLGPRRVTITS